jgi:hypothetical protein
MPCEKQKSKAIAALLKDVNPSCTLESAVELGMWPSPTSRQ